MLFRRGRMWLAMWMMTAVACASSAEDARVFDLRPMLSTDALVTTLHSAEWLDGRLFVRASLGNPRFGMMPTTLLQSEWNYRLVNKQSGEMLEGECFNKVWETLKNGRTFGPLETLPVTLAFKAPKEWLEQPLLLFAGTMPVEFEFSKGAAFTPVDYSAMPEICKIGATMKSVGQGWENVTMHVESTRITGDRLVVEMAFENHARFGFVMTTKQKGGHAFLVTAESEILQPLGATGEIAEQIPPAGSWAPGKRVRGLVSFPLPHSHGARSLRVVMPGFADLVLRHDAEKRAWIPETNARALLSDTPAARATAQQDRLFKGVSDFWTEVSQLIAKGDFAAVRRKFPADENPPLLSGIEGVPLAWFEIKPRPQHITVQNGKVPRLDLEVRYRLNGQPKQHAFLHLAECMIRAEADGRLLASNLVFHSRWPFWTRGFSKAVESQRIVMFYKPRPGEDEKAAATARTFEQAYAKLASTTRLPLVDRYVGFHCSSYEDYESLTGGRASMENGSVSQVSWDEDGAARVYNQAFFYNEAATRKVGPLLRWTEGASTIEHELVHLAMIDDTQPWLPGWLVEGLAMHYTRQVQVTDARILADAFATGLTLRAIAGMGPLVLKDDELLRVNVRYELAARVVGWLVENFDEEKVLAFYKAFPKTFPASWRAVVTTPDIEAANTPERQAERVRVTEQLLHKHFDLTIDDLDAAVRKIMRREAQNGR